MTKARVTTVLSVVTVLLALTAAIFNYLNNGRITWKAVAGVLVFVSLAFVIRGVTATGERGRDRQNRTKTS